MTIRFPCSNGFTLIDAADLPLVEGYRWRIDGPPERRYVCRWSPKVKGEKYLILMHRLIMDAPPELQVDHINGDATDNRRSNLRLCTKAENLRNRRMKRTNKWGFKGIYRHRDRWRAEIGAHGRKYRLGTYRTPQEAAAAYDEAAVRLHGEFARPNRAA